MGVLRDFTHGKTLAQIQDVASDVRSADVMAATINRYLSILRRIANLAQEWGLVEYAPRIKLLPEYNQRHIYLTPQEVARIASKCGPVVGDFVRLLALTGLRRGELLGLTPASIRQDSILLDARTKTGKARRVPLGPEALKIIQARLPWRLTVWDIRREFGAARKATGLTHVHLHDLRHTFASFLVQAGQNMKVVKELLGHTTMATTDRYAHLADGGLRQAINRLPSLGVRVGTKRSPRKQANR